MSPLSVDNMPLDMPQLATPDDSCTEVSSTIGAADEITTTNSRVKRRSIRLENMENTQNDRVVSSDRTVSGETLVENARALSNKSSQTSLLQAGINALDLPWNLSGFFKGKDAAVGRCEETPVSDSAPEAEPETYTAKTKFVESFTTIEPMSPAEARKSARISSSSIQHSQSETVPKSASRRSNRLSLLEKASDMVESATSVLGKRSRDSVNKGKDKVKDLGRRASLRVRKETIEPTVTPSFEGPVKKRKLADEGLSSGNDSFTIPRKPVPMGTTVQDKPVKLTLKEQREQKHAKVMEAIAKFRKDREGQLKDLEKLDIPLSTYENLTEAMVRKPGRNYKMPFKIFSPLPPGQPKPDEWRKTNKNVFVGEAGAIWRSDKMKEYSPCMCSPDNGCDDDCQNRCMFYECDDDNCNVGAACKNRSFEGLKQRTKKGSKYAIGVEVIKTEDRGYGVRSNRTFEPNQIIVEYTGEIITQDECENRMRTIYKNNECYYLMMFEQNMIIDATRGSIARFVNHSCEPNCRMEKWTVAGKPRMALFAGERGIQVGDELTYDYNFDPFSQKNVQECRCGAPNCRGVLGPKLNKEQIRAKLAEATAASNAGKKKATGMAGAKRKLQQIIDDSSAAVSSKKQKTIAKAKSVAAKVSTNKKATATSKSKTTLTTVTKKGANGKTKKEFVVKSKARRTASGSTANSAAASKKTKKPSLAKKATQSLSRTSSTKAVKSLVKAVSGSNVSRPKSKATSRPTTSTHSSTETLVPRSSANATRPASRTALSRPSTSASLKSVTGSVRGGVVKTVNGAKRGVRRTIRAL